MANIKLINHSSVLIQEGDNFVLTDPWFEKPAFGSWLPTPPISVHPAYLTALQNSKAKFNIVISHGHDDHLDDHFLSLFCKHTRIIIPKYSSKGVVSRLKRIGFKNIVEVSSEGETFDGFTFKSYINPEVSRDDAIVTVRSANSFIVHANDNWQKIGGETLVRILKDTKKFDSSQILYMSQCNLADGYPNIYKNFSKREKIKIHNLRVDNIISTSLSNAAVLGAKHFLNYAGYAASYVKGNPSLRDLTSYKTNAHVKKLQRKGKYAVEVLDMLPGDDFNFVEVKQQFPGIELSEKNLKKESYAFYESYDRVSVCDSYKQTPINSAEGLELDLKLFLDSFSEFVSVRVEATQFNVDIVGCKVIFEATDRDIRVEKVVGGEETFDSREATFSAPTGILRSVMSGEINWEHLYIGYAGEVTTQPKDLNIRAVVRWLAMYGYYYQKVQNGW